MAKKRTRAMERKLHKMRKKYGTGYCSDEYIETGVPKIRQQKIDSFKDELAPIIKELDKVHKKAAKQAVSKRKRRKLKIEDRLIFI